MPTLRTDRIALVAVIAAMIGSLAVGEASRGATFYVAPGGKDGNPGTQAQPLATLEAARDAARKAGAGPHRIVVMPGEYFLAAPLELDARDNGLTIEAEQAGKATLYGGRLVTGWRRDGEKLLVRRPAGSEGRDVGLPGAGRQRPHAAAGSVPGDRHAF